MYDIIFVKDTSFIGKSGFSHKFDFTLPKIKQRKEMAIKAINMPSNHKIDRVMWMIQDTRLVRSETDGLIIINDENENSNDIHQALKEYHINYIPWSQIENKIDKFKLVG